MNTNERSYRLDELLVIIQTKKHIKTAELAEMTGKTERTLRRDLKLLKERYPNIRMKAGRYDGGVIWEET